MIESKFEYKDKGRRQKVRKMTTRRYDGTEGKQFRSGDREDKR
jgi:hypothetical protein